MQKLVRKLVVDNDMFFEDVCSFATESYIGIWDTESDGFVLIARTDCEFGVYHLDECGSIEELDEMVYQYVGEHVLGVSNKADYVLSLIDDVKTDNDSYAYISSFNADNYIKDGKKCIYEVATEFSKYLQYQCIFTVMGSEYECWVYGKSKDHAMMNFFRKHSNVPLMNVKRFWEVG